MALDLKAMLVFLCVGLSMGFMAPRMCPDGSTTRASSHSVAKNVSLEFVNDAGIDVSVFWLNFEGEEVPVCVSALSFLSPVHCSLVSLCANTRLCTFSHILHVYAWAKSGGFVYHIRPYVHFIYYLLHRMSIFVLQFC